MKFKRLERNILYKSNWINLFVDKVQRPDGTIIEKYHVLDFDQQAVACLVENSAQELLFVKAYRYITGSSDWEIPAGAVEENEDIIAAAKRELLEETGYCISDLELLYTYYPSNGISNQVFHITRGHVGNVVSHTNNFDENEIAEYRWFTRQEIVDMLKYNLIKDGFTLTALLFYFREV